MSGRITFTPAVAAPCDRPAGCLDKPHPHVLAAGTIWTCDVCGREWVVVTGAQNNEAYTVWRRLTEANRSGSDR